jgi:hypothetical protein
MDHLETPVETPEKPGAAEANHHVAEVMRRAEQELHQLIEERAEVTKRIGTVKRTIVGLAKLFGNGNLDAVLLDFVYRKRGSHQLGITSACRKVLMQATRPMSLRDVCDEIQGMMPDVLARNKTPMSAISTVLRRLVEYGEATALRGDDGQRLWLWAAERNSISRPERDDKGSGPTI